MKDEAKIVAWFLIAIALGCIASATALVITNHDDWAFLPVLLLVFVFLG